MKILGGIYRGRNFYMPEGIRPTQSLPRKSLFDILGGGIEGASFLDLFAGSGSVGLEALSRGAGKITFVEKDYKVSRVLEETITSFGVKPDEQMRWPYEIVLKDGFATIKMFAEEKRKFDILFIDPPYRGDMAKKALKLLLAYDIVQPTSTVIIQHDKREVLPEDTGRLQLCRERKFGNTIMSIYKVR